MHQYQVTEHFEISGRGLGVLLNINTNLKSGRNFTAKITSTDGSKITCVASGELLLKKTGVEVEAFLLKGLLKQDVPIGSLVSFEKE